MEFETSRVNVMVTPETKERYKEAARRKGLNNMSAFIKLAAMEYCEREEKKRNIE